MREEKILNKKEIINQYCELIQKDKEYIQKYYIYNTREEKIKEILDKSWAWRKIKKGKEQEILNKQFESEEGISPFLRINDYYFDELLEIGEDYFNINENTNEEDYNRILNEENLRNIVLNDKGCSKRIKDCIIIYLESSKVCKLLYQFSKEEEFE